MLYCDYETYTAQGGRMTAEQYGVWGPRASRKIDELTLGRAAAHAVDCAEALADACARMADSLQFQAGAMAARAGGVQSENNDGYSVSYGDARSALQAAEAEARTILQSALGADPCGLLYRGVG